MSAPAPTPPETDNPLFDVVVRLPPNVSLEEVERRAIQDAGIRPDRVESLIKVLRSVPQAKIGAGVSRERADKAREQFSRAGLEVEVTSILALQTMVTGSFDGRVVCPACNNRVLLPDNRQCPSCGVFVDKISDEALLKRRMMEQEKARLDFQATKDAKQTEKSVREALEADLRAKVRKELEAQYGIGKGRSSRSMSLVKGVGILALLGVAFVGGRAMSTGSFSMESILGGSKSAKGSSPAEVDKMLDTVGPKGGAGPAAAAGGAAPGGGPAGDASADAGGPTGDVDVDDPLIQAAGGKRIGAKGLTIEQAVAASQTLAKAVGNTTAERAMAGAGVPGAAGGAAAPGAAPGGGTPGGGSAPGTTASPGAAGGTAGGGGPSAAAAGNSGPAAGPGVPAGLKLSLAAEFAGQLAELGQGGRGREVLKGVKAAPALASEASAAAAVRLADLEIQAWSLATPGSAKARTGVDTILANARALSDAAERARALTRVGVILSRNGSLPPEAARAFLTEASETLKSIGDGRQRAYAVSEWAVGLGEVLLAESTAKAKSGQWSKVQAAAAQLEALVRQAPDGFATARLSAIEYQVRQQLGQPDRATQSLNAALAAAGKVSHLGERASWLRAIGHLSGAAADEKVQASVGALQEQLKGKSGLEKAQAFTQLSLLHSEAGLRAKAAELAQSAQSTLGLSPADAVTVNAELMVRGDLAAAKVLHGVGLYAESEALLRKLAGYLL